MIRVAFVLLFVLMMPLVAAADPYTCDTTGCTWSTSYTEPVALTNNQPLTDLVSCTATYTVSIDGAAPVPANTKTFVIPASKPAGGGTITRNNTDSTMLPPHTYGIAETIACTSTAFGTGVPSAPGTLTMNSGVSVKATNAPTLQ